MRHVFEHKARFAFCQISGMSVTYKIWQNEFNIIFVSNSPKYLQ